MNSVPRGPLEDRAQTRHAHLVVRDTPYATMVIRIVRTLQGLVMLVDGAHKLFLMRLGDAISVGWITSHLRHSLPLRDRLILVSTATDATSTLIVILLHHDTAARRHVTLSRYHNAIRPSKLFVADASTNTKVDLAIFVRAEHFKNTRVACVVLPVGVKLHLYPFIIIK